MLYDFDYARALSGKAFEINNKFRTTEAFSILSIISSSMTFIAACYVAVYRKFGKSKSVYIGLLISCCCQIVTLFVFTDYYKNEIKLFKNEASFDGQEALTIGWVYVLGWIGFTIAGITGLFGCIMDDKKKFVFI